ncbi:Nramp family divalent metal transporter [Spongorhabdus nitratireducens]
MSRSSPGFLVTAAFIGPGTLTTASMAGAETGLSLAWAVILATLIAFILQEMAARLGLATGSGLSESLCQHCHNRPLKYAVATSIIITLGVSNSLYQAGNLTGAMSGLSLLFNFSPRTGLIILAVLVFALPLLGSLAVLEDILMATVLLMAAIFFITLMTVIPGAGNQLSALSGVKEAGLQPFYITALLGTTVVPYNLFLHASACAPLKKTGLSLKHKLAQLRLDAVISIAIGGFITLCILSTAAFTLAGKNTENEFSYLSGMLYPLLGDHGRLLFAAGMIAAGLSSALLAPVAAAFAICGVLGWQSHIRSPGFYTVLALVNLVGLIISLTDYKPVSLIIFVQASNCLLIPLMTFFLIIALNNKQAMNGLENRLPANILAIAALTVTLFLSLNQCLKLFGL